MGAFFGGAKAAGSILGSFNCTVLGDLTPLAKAMPAIARTTGQAAGIMYGFDLLSFGAGLFDPGNPLTALNSQLHANKFYNAVQLGLGSLAVFSAGFHKGTLEPVCFRAGTAVLTASGSAAIETLRPGDTVISTDPGTGESGERTVLRTFVSGSHELVHVFAGDGETVSTPGHLFLVESEGWTRAADLRAGNVLHTQGGGRLSVKRVRLEKRETPVRMILL